MDTGNKVYRVNHDDGRGDMGTFSTLEKAEIYAESLRHDGFWDVGVYPVELDYMEGAKKGRQYFCTLYPDGTVMREEAADCLLPVSPKENGKARRTGNGSNPRCFDSHSYRSHEEARTLAEECRAAYLASLKKQE